MKKAGIIIFCVLLLLGFFFVFGGKKSNKSTQPKKSQTSAVQDQSIGEKHSYIFVPYWTLDPELAQAPYDTFIYFGIAADKNGIETEEEGYKNLTKFNSYATGKQKLLTVRMITTSDNNEILKDTNVQDGIIKETTKIAKNNGFSGIVLDFEMQGLPFESLISNITDFDTRFAKYSQDNKLSFSTLLFGDNYYRIRPYNVRQIGKISDRVYIMSYDFHKARGNPGPTFPFDQKNEYGYDFQTMVSDFSKEVDKSKLTVVLGMFGYDWEVDLDGKSKSQGESKTTLQFERFLTRCTSENSCEATGSSSGENIKYKDGDALHTIWFETYDSAQKKIDHLASWGIYSIAWWAYSFF